MIAGQRDQPDMILVASLVATPPAKKHASALHPVLLHPVLHSSNREIQTENSCLPKPQMGPPCLAMRRREAWRGILTPHFYVFPKTEYLFPKIDFLDRNFKTKVVFKTICLGFEKF